MEQGVILQTQRLVLRRFDLQDVAALEPVLGDPLAMEYYPAPLDRTGIESWIRRNIERYKRHGHGLWAMLLKDSSELIGDCGCILQEVEGRNEIEVGYHVRRDQWNNGYATEAARDCIQYAFDRLQARRVISMIRPENVPSRRVAEKNGLVCEKVIFWRGYDHCVYVTNNTSV